ncbi:hypothetical protein P4V54_10520 [Brevibacillus nitrificans]|nr:hypothetical protein [Brevibacillus nitrificans]
MSDSVGLASKKGFQLEQFPYEKLLALYWQHKQMVSQYIPG